MEPNPRMETTGLASVREAVWVVSLGLVLAFARTISFPFVSNQNTYLLHGIGATFESLSDDWLMNTTDPYPFFSSMVGTWWSVFGFSGLRALELMGTFVALIGIWLIAKALIRTPSSRAPLAIMVAIGLSASVLVDAIPQRGLQLVSPEAANVFARVGPPDPFQGFGGQYLLSFLQPSLAGSLLLPAMGLWFLSQRRALTSLPRVVSGQWLVVGALLLASLAAMLHPTYLVVTQVARLVAVAVDYSMQRVTRKRVFAYAAASVSITAVTVLVNPGLMQVGSQSSSTTTALYRLAFERIPHHTLWTQWSPVDVVRLGLVLAAIWLAREVVNGIWIQRWIGGTLGVGLTLALVVEVTRWPTLALLFPWRISVVLVPLAAVVVLVGLARRTTKRFRISNVMENAGLYVLALVSVVAAIGGTLVSARQVPPTLGDASVRLVNETRPTGVGLIPLGAQAIRLNAQVPIYVDWKSHPLVGSEVSEWWSRIDLVRSWEQNPETLCVTELAASVDWVLMPQGTESPSCLNGWDTLGSSEGLVLLQKGKTA